MTDLDALERDLINTPRTVRFADRTLAAIRELREAREKLAFSRSHNMDIRLENDVLIQRLREAEAGWRTQGLEHSQQRHRADVAEQRIAALEQVRGAVLTVQRKYPRVWADYCAPDLDALLLAAVPK